MKSRAAFSILLPFVGMAVIVALSVASVNAESMKKPPGIMGTYQLVSRELPDGTKQKPPDVIGLITFMKDRRNFNIHWKDANGKSVSISSIATYKLTGKEYSEQNIYFMINDEIGGKGITYDLSGVNGTSPVKAKSSRIEFQLPLHGEPYVVFEGNKFTATEAGAFVDHWEKIK
jgi:hypothetical protein